MDTEQNRPFISVKFTSVGRALTFLLPDLEFDPPLAPGDPVVVQMGESRAYGAVTRTVPEMAARKAPAGSTAAGHAQGDTGRCGGKAQASAS